MTQHSVDPGPRLPRSKYANKLGEFPDFAFAGKEAFGFRGNWRDFFKSRIGPMFDGRLILEIGCYNAEFLCRVAAKFPNAAFVGLDWKCKAIYDGAQHVTRLGLSNIVLLRARGQDISRIFGDREVNEIWVFHPEPCDDDAEQKASLIAEPFLIDAHRVLKDGSSTLSFKTDHPEYYRRILRLVENPSLIQPSSRIDDSFDVTSKSSDYWRDRDALAQTALRSFSGEVTAYESRFMKKRLPIYYLEMRKK